MKERGILMSAPMVRATLRDVDPKWQTRRVVKPQPPANVRSAGVIYSAQPSNGEWSWLDSTELEWAGVVGGPFRCPYGVPGDRLLVREAWRTDRVLDKLKPSLLGTGAPIFYEADAPHQPSAGKLRPGMFMPRWASRITLEVTGVRVERLQDISEADAVAEGCAADVPETWWQGYKDMGEKLGLIHQQTMGEGPPDWMIEPHKMNPRPWLVRDAKHYYQVLWESINGRGSWDANPWVWCIEFKRVP